MQTVADKMTGDVVTCAPQERLSTVARRMWERDCGSVPVVDDAHRPLGVITDRDLCMAALMGGRALHEIAVGEALPTRDVLSCRATDELDAAHARMRESQVRRLPVVDDAGSLVGLLSLGDLVRPEGTAAARRKQADALLLTMAGITRPAGTDLASVLPARRAKAASKAASKPAAQPAPAAGKARPAASKARKGRGSASSKARKGGEASA